MADAAGVRGGAVGTGPTVLRMLRGVFRGSIVGPFVALLIAIAYFSVRAPDTFFQVSTFSLVLQQVMVVAVLAIGQTLIILTAGIDLSNGTVMAFGNIVIAKLAIESGVPPVLAILLGILACGVFGLVNGAFVTLVRIPSFIVTLGTFNIAFALTQLYSGGQTIQGQLNADGLPQAPSALTFFDRGFGIGGGGSVTYGVVLMLGLFGFVWYVLRHTRWGRHVYAVGDNAEATRRAGVHTHRLLLSVYAVAGLFYGVAAMLAVARAEGNGDPNIGQTDNLDSITAVVLGGTSLFGGRGLILGTLIGALIVGVIRSGLQITGVSSVYQILITGSLVILAVAVDELTRRRSTSR